MTLVNTQPSSLIHRTYSIYAVVQSIQLLAVTIDPCTYIRLYAALSDDYSAFNVDFRAKRLLCRLRCLLVTDSE